MGAAPIYELRQYSSRTCFFDSRYFKEDTKVPGLFCRVGVHTISTIQDKPPGLNLRSELVRKDPAHHLVTAGYLYRDTGMSYSSVIFQANRRFLLLNGNRPRREETLQISRNSPPVRRSQLSLGATSTHAPHPWRVAPSSLALLPKSASVPEETKKKKPTHEARE